MKEAEGQGEAKPEGPVADAAEVQAEEDQTTQEAAAMEGARRVEMIPSAQGSRPARSRR